MGRWVVIEGGRRQEEQRERSVMIGYESYHEIQNGQARHL